jgi:hypothetical protein
MDAKEIQTTRHAEKQCESTGTWRSTREWKGSVFEYRLEGDSECAGFGLLMLAHTP